MVWHHFHRQYTGCLPIAPLRFCSILAEGHSTSRDDHGRHLSLGMALYYNAANWSDPGYNIPPDRYLVAWHDG